MKKIFVPCEKRQADARGFWIDEKSGVTYRDFIRYEFKNVLTPKILKSYCKEYRQEAIFYEAINEKSGRYNSGTCYYKNGKKDVFNRKLTYYADGIHEAITAIKKIQARGLTCYTIEKDGKNRYIIFAWIKSEYKAKIQLKKKRILKRNLLLKKLIADLADGLPIQYRIQKNINSGGRYNAYHNKVTISPENIRHYRIKNGYGNNGDYYKNRGDKLNPLLLNNYKAFLRFIILHEIGHAKFTLKYGGFKNFTKWHFDIARREKYADVYALRQLKKRGVIQ